MNNRSTSSPMTQARFNALDSFRTMTFGNIKPSAIDSRQIDLLAIELYCHADLDSLAISVTDTLLGRQAHIADDFGFRALAWIEFSHGADAFFYWES